MELPLFLKVAAVSALVSVLHAALPQSESQPAGAVVIEVPKVPEVTAVVPVAPKVINQYETTGEMPYTPVDPYRHFEHKRNAKPVFSHRVPPAYNKTTLDEGELKVGEIRNSRLSLYLRGNYMEPDAVVKRLEDAGYKILAVEALDKKKQLVSIVFTCSALEAMGRQNGRGFAASLRILVDGINQQISITNPLYLSRAFMQNDFESAIPKAALDTLRTTFESQELKNSDDLLKYNLLPKYVFMNGMPSYGDMAMIERGDQAEMLAKAKKSKNVLFVQELSKTAAVVGVKLSSRTSKFVTKIGSQNGALLPYPALIENGEVKILDPKYYIAVMYPLLKMGDFMTISTVPGAIQNDVKKAFK